MFKIINLLNAKDHNLVMSQNKYKNKLYLIAIVNNNSFLAL